MKWNVIALIFQYRFNDWINNVIVYHFFMFWEKRDFPRLDFDTFINLSNGNNRQWHGQLCGSGSGVTGKICKAIYTSIKWVKIVLGLNELFQKLPSFCIMMTSSNWFFPALLAFCGGIHRLPVNSPHKGQWCGAWVFSLISVWING